MLNVLKRKYPFEYISDRSERGIYLFIIVVCFIIAFLILFDVMFIDFIIDNIKEKGQLQFEYLLYTIAVLMALDGIINVIVVIFSFNLLASINKHRSSIVQEINAIGRNS
jgi:ABC-type multidrug transport system fused ATPase/permease subunit